jgi:guanine nucleotide-exchange factor
MNGINFLEVHNLIPHDPKSIAWFLKETPGLDRVMIGDYFGQDDEFSLSVMHAYVDAMSFSDMRFDKALRVILFDIHLPREAEKVDRIIEKFAERYYRDNPRLFKNADTVYVLAYAVIMLNNDIHNSTILQKPSKADFVRMNTSGDDMEHAPQELLEEIYDSVVQEEIVYEDAAMRAEKLREQHSLASVLNLCGAQMRDISDAKEESKELVQGSQTTVRRGGGSRGGVFLQAKCEDFARQMLETVGWPVLAVFSLTMEDSENKSGMVEGLCIEGFRLGTQLAKTLDMDVMRYAFLTSLVRFTFLHAPREMRSKNVEALKMLLGLCQADPDALKDTWNAILECLSRLEYLTSPTHESTNILMLGGNQSSRHSLLLSLTELAGKPMEQVYINSAKLPGDVIVEFFTALCGVSHEELQQNPPRLFSLTKLIEISHYNMLRIRMVWGRIWAVLSSHFVVAGSHAEEKIAIYAINSLQELMIKCLERPELANFTFQERILKPFVVMMGTCKNPRIRALIVDSIKQMIKSKVGSLKSGWCSVFTVFTIAAEDDVEAISDVAFESVEQVILEDQVLGDCFVDCVTCLLAFANNKISSRSSLKAIALLRICEDRLADGTVIQGTSIQKNTANQTDVEIAEQYWFPMLAGLSDLTSDSRAEVRNCALDVLFDLLKVRGQSFSEPFWESVYDRALSPIFAFVRSVSQRREKPSSQDQWIEDACLHSLQLLCDLFSSFYKEVSFLLPSLLGLLLDCATCPDQTLASIAMGALIRLTEIAGHQFDDKDWTTLLDSLRDVCHSTQPVELLNPTSTAFLGSADSVPGSRKLRGPTTPISNFRGDPTTPTSQDATTTNEGRGIEFLANGSPLRTPPPHSVVANGDNASLNKQSVKSDTTSENNQLEQHSVVELEGVTLVNFNSVMFSESYARITCFFFSIYSPLTNSPFLGYVSVGV